MNWSRWKGRYALITGASSGIGKAFALQLANAGCHLILTARRKERLESLAEEIKAKSQVEVHVLEGDLSIADTPKALFDSLHSLKVDVDILVNNAGLGDLSPIADSELANLERMIEVNVSALVRLTHMFLPGMMKRSFGHIINVGSVNAFAPTPMMACYGATKAFLRSFGEALASEIKGSGVRITNVHPGGTKTEFTDQAKMKLSPSMEKTLMSPEKVARIALKKAYRGKLSVVTGFSNRFVVGLFWLLPNWVVRFIFYTLYKGLLPKKE